MPVNLARVKAKVSSTIQSRVENIVRRHIAGKLSTAAERIEHNAGKMLSTAVRHTRTYEALQDTSGVFGQDLQAEFGLKKDETARALRRLDWVVQNYGVFVTAQDITKLSLAKNGKSAAEFKILLFSRNKRSHPGQGRRNDSRKDYYQMLTKNKLFRYTSKRTVQERELTQPAGSPARIGERAAIQRRATSYQIEWMKWILDGRITGEVKNSLNSYGIRYNLIGSHEKAASRSGRAIMTSRKIVSYYTKKSERKGPQGKGKMEDMEAIGFPYQFPEAARSRAGYKNFLEEAASNKGLQTRIINMAKKVTLSVLKNPATFRDIRQTAGRPAGVANTTERRVSRSNLVPKKTNVEQY